MKADPVLDALKKASKGLLFPSESDAPLEAFAWNSTAKLTQVELLKLAGAEPGTAVEETTLADLFRAVPKEDRAKIAALQKALQEQLSSIQVYKVGDEAEREVYIIGKTKAGQWAGLKTTLVET